MSSATWTTEDVSTVPYHVFTDPEIFALEQERIFRGPTWNFVGLIAEIPQEGDFKTTQIGEVPVILTRAKGGAIHVLVNRCAHRGALVAREACGNRPRFTCVYHQWVYAQDGKLLSVPFRKGVAGKGGYGDDLCMADIGLTPLRVAEFNGLVFATFHPDTPSLSAYLGAVEPHLGRVFDGRPLTVLGYLRQKVRANWKLYFENTKDPYHASLLHTFVATFGLFRATQRGESLAEESGCGVLVSYRDSDEGAKDTYESEGVTTYQKSYALESAGFLATLPERDDGVAVSILSLPPGVVCHQISNSIAARQIIPLSPDSFELVWIMLGYADDSPELQNQRLDQTNLVGPSGYISLEDVEALEIVQRGIQGGEDEHSLLRLGGRHTQYGDPVDNLINETAIRGFWASWRRLMGI